MSFSVLMSLYAKERPEYLRESLDSVFCQTLPPDEVVLVEDGPLTAELYAVLDEYEAKHPELNRVPMQENGGLGRALNEGLRHCSYDLVARMDTDDIAKPERFEKQERIFSLYPNVEVSSCWIDEFEGDKSNVRTTRKLPEFSFEIFEYGKKRCPINHPAVMFKKNAVLFAGGYRHFPLFEDYYLWIRLLLNGAHFYNCQESLLYFRTTPEMYHRRGGLRHALTEIRFQKHVYDLGYISFVRLILNVAIRFTTRIIPTSLRRAIYKYFLR